MNVLLFLSSAVALCLLTACASGPRPADWQLEAKGAMDRAVAAYLEGNNRVEQAEMSRARAALSRTGRADLLANAELLRCATRVASLVFEPCTEFEALRPEATAAQRAYADYLRGQLQPQDADLLPEAQRSVAAGNAVAPPGLQKDPLSQLVAAGVWLQTGQAAVPLSMDTLSGEAVNTASAQGWRRPLLAWLGQQLRQAEQGGRLEAVARLQRRIAIAEGPSAIPPKALP
jgi:hypothetical protein